MKKFTLLMALIMLSFFALPAKSITVNQKDAGYIAVNTTVSKEMTPDTATVSFSVETNAKDSKVAAEKNKDISAKLINALKPLLDAQKKDTIQTRNLNLRPDYAYDKNTGKRTLSGYTMINTVTVKTKNLENVSKLVDVAIANDATNVSELRFFMENENDCAAKLVQEAAQKAKEISKVTAASIGQKITGVKSMNVNWGPSYDSYDNMRLYNAAKVENAGSAATPVEPGKVKIQANVRAEFYVE